jgi:hypothetical protein
MIEPDDWQHWSRLWQQAVPPGRDVLTEVKRERRRLHFAQAGDLLLTLFTLVQCWRLSAVEHGRWLVLSAIAACIVLSFFFIALWLRRDLLRSRALDLRGALVHGMRQAAARRKLVQLNLVGVALLPFVIAPLALDAWAQPQHRGFILLVASQAIVITVALVWCWRTWRRQSLRLNNLRSTLDALLKQEPGSVGDESGSGTEPSA